ncbi:MAG: hypothetical protein NT067_00145 [Candidatus Diapherotrites archaeon]|nr:hypothetical protein [Candidatus Diapherotrites archaeon]
MVLIKAEQAVLIAGLVLVLVASLPLWKAILPVEGLLATDALLVAVFFAFFLSKAKSFFRKDWKKYFIFFSLLLLIVEAATFIIIFLNPLEAGIELFIGIVLALLAVSVGGRIFLGKKEVEGTVLLSDSGSATVEITFDLFAGLNTGKYFVKADKKYAKGEKVKVALKSKWFKKVPDRIVGKAKE